jgi:hypothetical protein
MLNGEVLCIVVDDNHPSRRVADKVGIQWWRRVNWADDPASCDLLPRRIGNGGSPLLDPYGDQSR